MSVSAVSSQKPASDAVGESRVALIGVHAMRYPPGCILTPADFEQLTWYSHILPDGMEDVSDCLRGRQTPYGELLHTVACAFDAFDFNAVGQSRGETPGGIAWDGENVTAWSSFFSSLIKIAEMSEAHFPTGPHVFDPGERVPIFHAHFVTLWNYRMHPLADGRMQETDYQLLGELDLYSPLLSRAIKGRAEPPRRSPGTVRDSAYPSPSKAGTVRVKDEAAARKKRPGTISLSPALRKLTTRSYLSRSGPTPEPPLPRGM